MIPLIDPKKFQWTRYRQYFTIKRSFTYGYTRDQDNKKNKKRDDADTKRERYKKKKQSDVSEWQLIIIEQR